MASKFATADFNGEQSLARKAKKLRDSWSFRSILSIRCLRPYKAEESADYVKEMSQGDEEELLAISFAGLYDLERGTSFILHVNMAQEANVRVAHAPNGVYQALSDAETALSDVSFCSDSTSYESRSCPN
jgi:hypothetical protein